MTRERPLGADRTEDDLLSLEDEAMPRRRLMVNMAVNLYRLVLMGSRAPIHAVMFERMAKPRPGDLVIELTSVHRSPDPEYRGFGILLKYRQELAYREDDGRKIYETVWYVQYGPAMNDVVRWENASFIAVPNEIFEMEVESRDSQRTQEEVHRTSDDMGQRHCRRDNIRNRS